MSQTSIDGLTIRSASASQPRGVRSTHAHATSARSVSGILRPASKKHISSEDDDFSDTDESLSLASISDQFVDEATSDWSDLLDDFNSQKTHQKTSQASAKRASSKSSKKATKKSSDADDFFSEDFFIDENADSPRKKSSKSKKPRKAKSKKSKIIRRVLAGTLVVILAVAFIFGDSIIHRFSNGNSGILDFIVAAVSPAQPFATDENGRTNILVFGTEGYTMNGDVGESQHDGADLTDSIMVVSLDQETKDVALLSIPRDLKVSRGCFAGKINEVYTCNNPNANDEIAGATALEEQLTEILGIEFQYQVHVNWSALIDIIDALGGITITLDEDIADYWNTGIVIDAGVPTEVDGATALGIARARYGTIGGDFTRGSSQQKIVEGIAQKIIDDGISFSELLSLANILVLSDNLRTDIPSENFKTAVDLLSGFNPTSIRNIPLVDYENEIYYVTTEEINGVSYVVPASGFGLRGIQQYISRMFSSNPVVREGATVAIYNATDVSGVAGAERTRLENDGYTIDLIGDADESDCNEPYCVYVLDESMVATSSALEERYGILAQSANNLPQDIYPDGASIVIIIGSVSQDTTQDS